MSHAQLKTRRWWWRWWPTVVIAVMLTLLPGTRQVAQAQTPSQPVVTPRTTDTSPRPTTTPTITLGGGQTDAPNRAGRTGNTTTTTTSAQLPSSQFLDPAGLTVERLVASGFERRADLLAARRELVVAEGRLAQAGLRPNPTLDTEYGSARLLGGSAESQLDVGFSQVFETSGKRGKRVVVARAEVEAARAQVSARERRLAAEVRAAYARAVAAGRQLDTLDELIRANEELVRVTGARLKEGDVAPLDLGLVRVETDRLRAQVIRARADAEAEIISLRALAGFAPDEPLRLAPLSERPPRLDLSAAALTEVALRERPDLRAARLGEDAGAARIRLAQAQATPDVAGTVRYSRERRITDLPKSLGIGPVDQTDNVLRFGVSIELPVFNKNQGGIAAAIGEREQLRRQREFLEATIKREVALAYNRYRAAAEALVLYATQIVPRSEENLRGVRAAHSLGEFSIFEVVNEQRRLLESQTGYNEALRDYYGALAELESALGIAVPANGFAAANISVLPELDQPDANARRASVDWLKALRTHAPSATTPQPASPSSLAMPPQLN